MTEKQAKLLAYPFTADEIEWRVLLTTKDKSKGLVAAYIDSRAIQKRLDDVLGRENWKNHFITMPGNSNSTTAHICEISIYYPERQEWITKSDGAGSTDIEPIKGGLSNAFKRAASIWNIGRYLYELPGIWVALKDGKYIDPAEKPKLTKHYNQFVNQYLKAQQAAEQKRDTAQAAAPDVSASPAVAPAAAGRFQGQAPAAQPDTYRIAQLNRTQGTHPNTLVVLQSPAGEKVTGYIKGEPSLQVGQNLRGLKIIEKNDPVAGRYNIIESYEAAA